MSRNNFTTDFPTEHIKTMQEQAEADYLELADRWRIGLATEDELQEAADFAAQWDDQRETLSDELASKTVRDYCCAQCWGHLITFPAPGHTWIVECAQYGSEHAGYVTKNYTTRRQSESIGDKMDADHMLQQIGVTENPHKGKTAEQLISELGF